MRESPRWPWVSKGEKPASAMFRKRHFATMGVPVKLQLSTLVQSQAEERGSLLLEKVLGLADEWLPLNSSFVQSGNEGGRPTQTDVTESGEKSRTNEDNIDR